MFLSAIQSLENSHFCLNNDYSSFLLFELESLEKRGVHSCKLYYYGRNHSDIVMWAKEKRRGPKL